MKKYRVIKETNGFGRSLTQIKTKTGWLGKWEHAYYASNLEDAKRYIEDEHKRNAVTVEVLYETEWM